MQKHLFLKKQMSTHFLVSQVGISGLCGSGETSLPVERVVLQEKRIHLRGLETWLQNSLLAVTHPIIQANSSPLQVFVYPVPKCWCLYPSWKANDIITAGPGMLLPSSPSWSSSLHPPGMKGLPGEQALLKTGNAAGGDPVLSCPVFPHVSQGLGDNSPWVTLSKKIQIITKSMPLCRVAFFGT